jgi:hypothetical protein
MPSRAYISRFNFKGTDQGKRVGDLSGGERGRLHLAKTQWIRNNGWARKAQNQSGFATSRSASERTLITTLAGCPKTLRKHIMPRNYTSNILFYKEFF